jgi:DNA polymerase/3'-5' exonuclease PolX
MVPEIMKIMFMLAKEYHNGMSAPRSDPECLPPLGWLASEKYDGYRARWMGKNQEKDEKIFLSRAKNIFNAHELFKLAMPDENLDGELWVGRENFQMMGVVRKKIPILEEWKHVQYIVYDLPDMKKPFSERIKALRKIVRENKERWDKLVSTLPKEFQIECPLKMAKQTLIESEEQMKKLYKGILDKGGEGIMIKDPDSFYEDKRSNKMLKVKPDFEEEALIVDFKLGKGKNKGILGSFICAPLTNMDTYHLRDKDPNHEFSISGMDDSVRNDYEETHPIGTVVSIIHSGKTDGGKPRFARYVRKRDDIIIKDEIENPTVQKRNDVIFILKKISDYEKANGEAFKANSYLKVISELKKFKDDSDLTEENIRDIRGVGDAIFKKIDQIIKTGSCTLYDKIKNIVDPREVFLNVHGIGPKRANELLKMGINSIEDLRKKKEYLNDKQKIGLQYYEELLQKIPHEEIVNHERHLKNFLKKTDKNAELTIAGSYRRNKEESGDIDVLLKCEKRETFTKFIKNLVNQGYLVEELALGNKKYNGICKLGRHGNGRRIDIMYTKPEEYPFAILYFTGSGEFNQMMRKLVNDKGYTMNEYSIKHSDTKQKVDHTFTVEKDIFDFLEMGYVEPWQRL